MGREERETSVMKTATVPNVAQLPTPAQAVNLNALAIKFDFKAPEQPTRKRYWLGVFKDAPVFNFYAGGQCFPRYTQDVTQDPNTGEMSRVNKRGAIYMLTEDQKERILSDVQQKVVRWRGWTQNEVAKDKGPQQLGEIHDLRSKHFELNRQSDIPAACYLWMVEITDNMPDGWRSMEPPRMMPLPPRVAEPEMAVPQEKDF
jgi:hypothetical protein